MKKIGTKTLNSGIELISGLLHNRTFEINEAFDENAGVDIGLSIKIRPTDSMGRFEVEGGINFVKSRCKESVKDFVDEIQMELKLTKGGAKREDTP